jgi:hypothetical protein
LREEYTKEVNDYNNSMEKVLKDGFGLGTEEVFEFLSDSEANVN